MFEAITENDRGIFVFVFQFVLPYKLFIASGRRKCEHAKLTDVNMCAFGGGCEGDSGGGLVIQNAKG